jgi:transposase
VIAICRMSRDKRTRAYVERRTKEGKSKKEIIRCLKRYIAREVYRILASLSLNKPPVLQYLDEHRSITRLLD